MKIDFIKNNIFITLLAIVVGLVTVLPQIYAIHNLGDDFKGVYQTVNDDEDYYKIRAKEVVDAHYRLANPYIYEYKNETPMQFWMPDFIIAIPIKIFNLDINKVFLFYDFLFPFILTILSFIILKLLTKSEYISILGAAVLHLGLYLEYLNRALSPQFIFIFWLIFLLSFINFIKKENTKNLIKFTLVFGVLFYVYPYYWTYAVILFFVYSALVLLFYKKLNIRKYFIIFSGALLIGSFYLIEMLSSMKNPFYEESLNRLGMLYTHFPSGIYILSISIPVLLVFGILYLKNKNLNKFELFLVSSNLSSIIAVNQHVITGQNLEFTSHYYLLSEYISAISVLYFISLIIIYFNNKKVIKIAMGLLVLVYIFNSASFVVAKQAKFSEKEIERQKYAEVLSWINENIQKDSVVLSDNQVLTNLIPLYTSSNVFYVRGANLFFMPDEEVKERFLINNYWNEIDREFILKNERAIWGTKYINGYAHNQSKNKLRRFFGKDKVDYIRLPKEEIANILMTAEELKSKSFSDLIKDYKLNYILMNNDQVLDYKIVKEFNKIGMTMYEVE